MSDNHDASAAVVEPGEEVYSDSGQLLGYVNSFTEGGFEVSSADLTHSDGTALEEIPGKEFGEGYLMWECGECGEMGELDGSIPDECPNCGAPREAISKARED